MLLDLKFFFQENSKVYYDQLNLFQEGSSKKSFTLAINQKKKKRKASKQLPLGKCALYGGPHFGRLELPVALGVQRFTTWRASEDELKSGRRPAHRSAWTLRGPREETPGLDKGCSPGRPGCACATERACARRSAPRPEAWRDPGREARRGASRAARRGEGVGRSRAPPGGRKGRCPHRPRCPPLPWGGSRSRGSRLRCPPASRTRSLGRARAHSLRHPPAPAPAAAPAPPPTFCCRRRHNHLPLRCPLLSSPPVDYQVSAAALKSGPLLPLCAILLPPLAPEVDLGRWASVRRNGGGLSAPSALESWEGTRARDARTRANACIYECWGPHHRLCAKEGEAVPAGWGADDGDLGKGLFYNLDISFLPQWAWVCVCVWGSNDDPRNQI